MRILPLTKSRRGSAGITYGLTVGLIAVVAVTAVQQFGGAISGLTNSVASGISQTKTISAPNCPDTRYVDVGDPGLNPLSYSVPETPAGDAYPLQVSYGLNPEYVDAQCGEDGSWIDFGHDGKIFSAQ